MRAWPNERHVQELRDDASAEVPAVVPNTSRFALADALPPDLARVVATWSPPAEDVKAGLLALVQAAGGSDE